MSSIVQGVFAINKPTSISSGQVIRDLQNYFVDSKLFAPLIAAGKEKSDQGNRWRKRNKRKSNAFKIGHGGTLDPLASGVMTVGVGAGTKTLGSFLECTKSYDTIMTFGVATDSYDRVGKIVARGETNAITRAQVEEALDGFRGKIMQVPPIFSALKVNGKPMYEYAREGKEIPKKIEARPVEVVKLELVDWWDTGKHTFKLPTEEAPNEEKEAAEKLMQAVDEADKTGPGGEKEGGEATQGQTRKRERDHSTDGRKAKRPRTEVEIANALAARSTIEQGMESEMAAAGTEPTQCPAAKLRMTVSGGFYVRALCHDLGKAVGSYGLMSELSRTRQGDFELGEDVLEYSELEKGEDVWGPKLKSLLEKWAQKNGQSGENKPNEERKSTASHQVLPQSKSGSTPKSRSRSKSGSPAKS